MPIQALQSYAVSLAAHRLLLYVVFSLGAVAAVIANALKRQSNFYSVAVFLSRSNGSVVVCMTTFAFDTTMLMRAHIGVRELRSPHCFVVRTSISAGVLWALEGA